MWSRSRVDKVYTRYDTVSHPREMAIGTRMLITFAVREPITDLVLARLAITP
jgi:hypothetical protein